MRKLNEQWIETIDGEQRMVKAVKRLDKISWCSGCLFLDESDDDCTRNITPCGNMEFIIKDLGPVNEEGFLAEERTGLFPEISHDTRSGIYEAVVYATLIDPPLCPVLVRVQASSMDRLRDAWNRRNI